MRIVAVVLLGLAVLPPSPALAADPVKIGFIAPLTGLFAPAGKDMREQFWTYRPDEFLKTPAYDRNYPPVKP